MSREYQNAVYSLSKGWGCRKGRQRDTFEKHDELNVRAYV